MNPLILTHMICVWPPAGLESSEAQQQQSWRAEARTLLIPLSRDPWSRPLLKTAKSAKDDVNLGHAGFTLYWFHLTSSMLIMPSDLQKATKKAERHEESPDL